MGLRRRLFFRGGSICSSEWRAMLILSVGVLMGDSTRMCITYEFQRYIPMVNSEMNGMFHSRKAEEWCECPFLPIPFLTN